MKAPDKIYLQACGSCDIYADCKTCEWEELRDNVTWSEDRIFKKDIEYIRKDALLKTLAKMDKTIWAEKLKNDDYDDASYIEGEIYILEGVINIINSL